MIVAALAVTTLAACAGDTGTRHVEHGIALRVPSTWSVTGFSVNVTPERLLAASYDVDAADIEGGCESLVAAVTRLPRDGAYVALIDYGPYVDADDFTEWAPASGRDDPFSSSRFAEYECFGPSYAFRFVVEGRALQAHVGLGAQATAERREEALEVLNSITVRAPLSHSRRRQDRRFVTVCS